MLESALIGAPHPDLGESLVAVLVPASDAEPDIAAIRQALKAQLAGFKQPRAYVLADARPRNTMGKVQKNALRERHARIIETGQARATAPASS